MTQGPAQAQVKRMASHDSPQQHDSSEDPGTVMFGHHVVAIIDFLGQASKLAQWDFLPRSPQEEAQFVNAIRKSFGLIHASREDFEKYFTLWQENIRVPDNALVDQPDRREVLLKFQENLLGFMHFSDTIVVYSPLKNQYGYLNVGGVCGFIWVCGTLMLSALFQRIVFRGAIDIGMAGCFPKADLYGPALAKAHFLESKVAKYPRIVVGPSLLDYLQFHVDGPDTDGPARANHVMAAKCLRMLSEDSDGSWIIDYLNDDTFASPRSDKSARCRLKDGAAKFVDDELERFKSEGNAILVERYECLAAYFQRHGVGS